MSDVQIKSLDKKAKFTTHLLLAITKAIKQPDTEIVFSGPKLTTLAQLQTAVRDLRNISCIAGVPLDVAIVDKTAVFSYPLKRLELAESFATDPIDKTSFGKGAVLALEFFGCEFNGQLRDFTQEEILSVPGCGNRGLRQIVEYSRSKGVEIPKSW